MINTRFPMWQKIKENRLFRLLVNKYLITGVAFVLWITFFDDNNLIELAKVKLNIINQEKQKQYYKSEIKLIEQKLQELDSNVDSLEKFAREQYHYKLPDEEIYVFKGDVK